MTYERLLNRIKTQRLNRGWSQEELARRARISRTAVTAIEGRRLIPSVASALALAAAFDCAVEDLFGPGSATCPAEPGWAWPPAQMPCRYWQAQVGQRQLFFPVEPTVAGMPEHDGVFADEVFQSRHSFSPEQTLVMACCDPAAGLLTAQLGHVAGIRLLVLSRSSQESLDLLGRGVIHVAGVHLSSVQTPEGNRRAVRGKLGAGFCLLRLAHWEEGIALSPHLRMRSVREAVRARLRWVGREPGSGARQCLDELLEGRPAPRRLARNHRAVAEAIRSGWADAGVCLRLVSAESGLPFFTVREEVFDLCFADAMAHDPRILALQRIVRSTTYRRLLADLPGYDSSATGELERIH